MVTHFFKASTKEHLWTSDITDVVPERGDTIVTPEGKTFIVIQRIFDCQLVATPPASGLINIAATPAKALNVEIQVLLMEFQPSVDDTGPSERIAQ